MYHDYTEESQRTCYDESVKDEFECTGFMDVPREDPKTGVPEDLPSEWSCCSVNDFRKAYTKNQWGKTCFIDRSNSGKHPVVP